MTWQGPRVECREAMAADAYYSYVLRDLESVP
jgi:hypothetical protein